MKIIAVGWNYKKHNQEMEVKTTLEHPTIFMKAETALLKDGKPFFIPEHLGSIEYEGELVVRIDRMGKNIAPQFASRYYHEVTVGVDFTARELQTELRKKGEPWELSKSFDGSAAIGDFMTIDYLGGLDNLNFALQVNGKQRQAASVNEMVHSIDHIVSYVSRYLTLKVGDLIFTGTPEGVGKIQINDRIQGYINGIHEVLCFNVK